MQQPLPAIDIELEPLAIRSADRDGELLRAHQIAGSFLAVGSGFGIVMARAEQGLTPAERARAYLFSGVAVAFGTAGVLVPRHFAWAIRQARPATLPLAGLISVAVTRPTKSPMFFPSVLLTAAGAAEMDVRAARRLGRVAGAGWVALVLRDARRLDRGIAWHLGMWSAYSAAGVVGAILGRVATDVRTVERARQRDNELLERLANASELLETAARDAGEVARDLDRELLELPSRYEISGGLERQLATVRAPMHHLEMARRLVAAARNATVDVHEEVEAMATSYAQPLDASGARISTSVNLRCPTHHSQMALALLICLKRAIDNAIAHGRDLREVQVDLVEAHGQLRLSVEDDGGGAAPPQALWGTGLSEAQQRAEQLGGELFMGSTDRGVRLELRLPVELASASAQRQDASAQFSERVERAITAIVKEVRTATLSQGLASIAEADSPRSAAAASAAFAAAWALDEASDQNGDPTVPVVAMALVASLWPRGGRPAGGWLGIKLLERVWIGRGALRAALVVTGCSAVGALRVRSSVEQGRIVENLTFPLLCGSLGLMLNVGRGRVAKFEQSHLVLRRQAHFVETLAPSIEAFHDYISPIKASGSFRQLRIEDRRRLEDLRRRIDGPARTLRRLIPTEDPLAEMQRHLALRLSPVEVRVSGTQPLMDETREQKRLLARARRTIDLIAHADEIADELLDRFPATLIGQRQLAAIELYLTPTRDGRWSLDVTPTVTEQAVAKRWRSRLTGAEDGRADAQANRTFILTVDEVARASSSS